MATCLFFSVVPSSGMLPASSMTTTGNARPDCRLIAFRIGMLASPITYVTLSRGGRFAADDDGAARRAPAVALGRPVAFALPFLGPDCDAPDSSQDDRSASTAAAADGSRIVHATPHAALARAAQRRHCDCVCVGATTTTASATPRVSAARWRPIESACE